MIELLHKGFTRGALAVGHQIAWRRQETGVAEIAALTTWIRSHPVDDTLVSVVMPTRNRSSIIGPAITSVLRQSHQNWELLVADDGSDDETADLVSRTTDRRIRLLSGPRLGVAGARNRAMDAARGELVCYLDDDNEMSEDWLRAVTWAARRFPDVRNFYGARIVDGGEILFGMRRSPLPQYHFVPFSAALLRMANFIDVGVFAHRRGALRFSGAYAQAADWDFILRSTSASPPLALPIVANLYRTTIEGRLTADGTRQGEEDRVRRSRNVGKRHRSDA